MEKESGLKASSKIYFKDRCKNLYRVFKRLLKEKLKSKINYFDNIKDFVFEKNIERKISKIEKYLKNRANKSKNQAVCLLHISHIELAESLLERAVTASNGSLDIIVTCRPDIMEDVKTLVSEFDKGAKVFSLGGTDDIFPFLVTMKSAALAGYKYFCKAYTKSEDDSEIVGLARRESLLDGVFPKKVPLGEIINSFENNLYLNSLGSAINYLSYRYTKKDDHDAVNNIARIFGFEVEDYKDWGFFSGGMFWGRVDVFSKIDISLIPKSLFKKDVNSFFEKVFGLCSYKNESQVGLIDYKLSAERCDESLRVRSASNFLKVRSSIRYEAYLKKERFTKKALLLKAGVTDPFWCYKNYDEGGSYFDCIDKYLNGDISYLSSDHKDGVIKLVFEDLSLCVNRNGAMTHYTLSGDYLTDNLLYKHPTRSQLSLRNETDITVSVVCITYNHALYVRQAIESMLDQKVDFNYEILIGDDCSSDGTSEIIEGICKNSEEKIVYIKRAENIGARRNIYDLVSRARGKYIALNEGDDFWIDKNKLQKQVDYMERFPECAATFHQVKVVDQDGDNLLNIFPGSTPGDIFVTEDLIEKNYIQTNSVLWRANNTQSVDVDMRLMPGDWFRHFLNSLCGEIHMMPDVMSAYRKHSGGVWSGVDDLKKDWGFEQVVFFSEMNRVSSGFFYKALIGRIYSLFQEAFWHLYEKHDAQKLFELVKFNSLLTNYFFFRSGIKVEWRDWESDKIFISELSEAISVDVIITAYMQEHDIEQAIDSVVMQKGFFSLKIICSDDGSIDSTRRIIKKYAHDYPSLIVDISNDKNVGMLGNLKKSLGRASAEFIAFCEGDDYWLSDSKISSQIAFMFRNPDFTMCFNWLLLDYVDKGASIPHPGQQNIKGNCIDFDYILKTAVTANFSCCMYRKKYVDKIPDTYFETDRAADWLFNLYVTSYGPAGFLRNILSVYRVHKKGQWSGMSQLSQERRKEENYKNFINLFPEHSDLINTMISPKLDNIYFDGSGNLSEHCGSSIRSNFDSIRFYGNFLSVRGWILDREGSSLKSEEKYLVVKGTSSGASQAFSLTNIYRPDVSRAFSRRPDEFSWSGFYGGEILSLPDDHYEIFVVKVLGNNFYAYKHKNSFTVREGKCFSVQEYKHD